MTNATSHLPMPCPHCDDGHELTRLQLGAHTIYRCERSGQEFVEEGAPDPTMYAMAGDADGETLPGAAAWVDSMVDTTIPLRGDTDAGDSPPAPASSAEPAITLNTPDPSVTQRGSVVNYLKSMYRTDLEPPSAASLDNKYEMAEEIAQGGMGKVSVARDVDLNRRVAMKTLLPKFLRSPQFVSKFVEEAQTIGQLEHPNIVPVYDVGMHASGELYFTMKYVRGQTLEAVIEALQAGDPAAHARYTWTRRAQIIQQICDALEFAHQKDVIHRDLKPANIMIGEFGEVQVMDWGISKRLESAERAASADKPAGGGSEMSSVKLSAIAPHTTQVGSVVGTAYYMSPEQASGKNEELTPATDIYSLGAVMYELFGLKRPHEGESAYLVLASVIKDEPEALSKHHPPGQGTVPIEIDYICRHAMIKDPAFRFESAAAMKADIQLFLDGTYPIVCPHTALKRGSTALSHLIDNHAMGVIMGLFAAIFMTVFGIIAFVMLAGN